MNAEKAGSVRIDCSICIYPENLRSMGLDLTEKAPGLTIGGFRSFQGLRLRLRPSRVSREKKLRRLPRAWLT